MREIALWYRRQRICRNSLTKDTARLIKMSDDVKAVMREDGKTDNYFGGEGKADGPGHGHIVVTEGGDVDYARDSASNGGEVSVDKK